MIERNKVTSTNSPGGGMGEGRRRPQGVEE